MPRILYILQQLQAVLSRPACDILTFGEISNICILWCNNLRNYKPCNKRIFCIWWRLYFAVIVTQPPTAAHVTCKKKKKYALNASSYIMLYYIAYVLLLGHRRLTLPPRSVQRVCKCRKCIYLYFFSEISIYFCVLSFWSPGTLWHNSKHNKMRTSWDWEIRGVPSRFLFNNILCGHKKKEKKKDGRRRFQYVCIERTHNII